MFESLKNAQQKMAEDVERKMNEMRVVSNINNLEHQNELMKVKRTELQKENKSINKLDKKYQKIYAKLKNEHDRLQKAHFYGIVFSLICIYIIPYNGHFVFIQ